MGANATWVLGGMLKRINTALVVSITCFTTPSMGAESGRVDALALPAVHYKTEILEDEQKIEEIRRLREFIERVAPGAQVWIVPPGSTKDEVAKKSHLERLPFTWNGDNIYIRRKTVYDMKVKVSA